MKFTRIMVPLDGSPFAEQALQYAEEMARLHGACLFLLSVCSEECLAEPARDYLERHMRRLQGAGLSVMTLVSAGDPVDCILREVRVQEVDLVVMCSHSRKGLERWLLGSVADEVLHGSPCPTLIVRAEEQAPAAPPEHRRVLVPLDGSPEAEAALDYLPVYARDCEVVLLRVVERSQQEYFATPYVPELAHRLAEMAHAYLEGCVRRLTAKGLQVRSLVLIGSTRREVLLAAEREQAALLILTSLARRGAVRALLGSVAETVCRSAPCPVLRVKPGRPVPQSDRILITLDGSHVAEESLVYCRQLDSRKATLMMVTDLPAEPLPHLVEDCQRLSDGFQNYLERRAAPLRDEGWEVDCLILVGDPASRIVEQAESVAYRAILMTTHGRTGARRWLLGSVAETVARRSDTPVLLLHSPPKEDESQATERREAVERASESLAS